MNRKYYKKHRFVGTFEATKPVLMVTDPTLARDIFVANFKNFSSNSLADKLNLKLDPLFGRNPFNRYNEDWKQSRNVISSAFTALKVIIF